MSTYADPNDFLLSSGAPSAKFPTIGTTVRGTVVSSDVTQQRDIDGKPKVYDDGNPMMQLVVTLQTDERDAAITDDDGTRRLFIKGQMLAAVRAAVKKANARLEPGGTLVVKYTDDKPAEKAGRNPAKVYEAAYKPGANTGVDDLLGAGQPAAAAAGPSASELI